MGDLELARRLALDGIRDERVLAAIASLDRREFVPEAERALAGQDVALDIGHFQTISQPYVVARMTEALALEGGERALEVGTGSGYQAAVLARLGCQVYSVEVIGPLFVLARQRLELLGLPGVHLRLGDGRQGWPEAAPFDVILVTAATEEVPETLLDQLADWGRLVAPVGPQGSSQELVRMFKDPRKDRLQVDRLLPVQFVPLQGGA